MGKILVQTRESIWELGKLFGIPEHRRVRSFSLHASCDELAVMEVNYFVEEGDIQVETIKKRFNVNLIPIVEDKSDVLVSPLLLENSPLLLEKEKADVEV